MYPHLNMMRQQSSPTSGKEKDDFRGYEHFLVRIIRQGFYLNVLCVAVHVDALPHVLEYCIGTSIINISIEINRESCEITFALIFEAVWKTLFIQIAIFT